MNKCVREAVSDSVLSVNVSLPPKCPSHFGVTSNVLPEFDATKIIIPEFGAE